MRRSEGWHPKSWDLVCSSDFKDEDFDRTGQTVRLRDNVEPSVFTIPEHLRQVRIEFKKLKQSVSYTKYHFQK